MTTAATDARPISDREELLFFGRINASVSHDIKNVLAVINENAGLLSDLTLLAGQGRPLEPEQLRKVADSIQQHIRRGDEMVKSMNAFAHTVDEAVMRTDINEQVALLARLGRRVAAAKSVTLEVKDTANAEASVDVYTLHRVLHGMLVASLEGMNGGTLVWAIDADPQKVSIRLLGGCWTKDLMELHGLAKTIHASLLVQDDKESPELCLEISTDRNA